MGTAADALNREKAEHKNDNERPEDSLRGHEENPHAQ